MKPTAFAYARPATVADAVKALASTADAKLLAGGQTLGPMLNLRLAQPGLLVDITRIAELAAIESASDWIRIGATVTHAAIEDGRCSFEGSLGAFLPRVARGIAYRAVRTRGTIGGSLAHADPAADWLCSLAALGAEVVIAGPAGERKVPLQTFVRAPMETELGADELIVAVRIPRFSRNARFGYHKICRKRGEFADAIGAVALDPERGSATLVAGGGDGLLTVIDGADVGFARGATGASQPSVETLQRALVGAKFSGDAYDLKLRAVALRRAIEEALGA
jgi:carbon-monoxide dehydrogenase medium subunit